MKYIYSILLCTIFLGCTNSNQSIIKTEDDLSSNIKNGFESYASNDFSFSDQYSEDVVSRINNMVIDGRDNLMSGWKAHHDLLYKDINIQDVYVHTNYFNNGEVWSNAWFTWNATGQITGEEYSNRGHFDYKWEDGKIVEVLAYFSEYPDNNEGKALAESQN